MYINLFICRLDFHHTRREEKNQVINVMNNRHVELCLTYNILQHYISSTYQCHLKYEKAFLYDIIFSSSLLVLFNECDRSVFCAPMSVLMNFILLLQGPLVRTSRRWIYFRKDVQRVLVNQHIRRPLKYIFLPYLSKEVQFQLIYNWCCGQHSGASIQRLWFDSQPCPPFFFSIQFVDRHEFDNHSFIKNVNHVCISQSCNW